MSVYLVDTHTFIWSLYTPEKIAPKVLDILADNDSTFLLSKASIWEMFIKVRNEKLTFHKPLRDILDDLEAGKLFVIEDIHLRDLDAVSKLQTFHRDPFDHLLIAQAMNRNIPILSSDRHFEKYPVKVIWQ